LTKAAFAARAMRVLAPADLRTHRIAMRRRVIAAIRFRRRQRFVSRAALLFFPAALDLLLEAIPLCLLGVFVFLTRVAMLAARTPVAIAWWSTAAIAI